MGDESSSLFEQPRIVASFPTPRPFQDKAHELLRAGYRQKHRNQLICASTGSGKTVLAMRIIYEALLKNKSAAFVCDRTTLINQTSEVADSLGLPHGIIQADHWRKDRSKNFQIASVQTLARRKWPHFDVMVIDECFTGDVEILTEKGFVRFDALTEDLKCAQFDHGLISFVSPDAHIKSHYRGRIVRLRSDRKCDLSMTPGHELLLHGRSGAWRKEAVASAPLNPRWNMYAAGLALYGNGDALTPFERLMIAAQADGSIHHQSSTSTSISFTFVKQRKIDRFISIMADGQFAFSEVKASAGKRRFIVRDLPPSASKNLWDHFAIPDIAAGKASEIIDEMVEWDGSIVSDSLWYFSSTDARASDFYQCVALLCGMRSTITVQHDDRSDSYNDVYRLFIHLGKSTLSAQSIGRESVWDYDGHVYCVRVPAGNIIVRRNGMPLVVGNCHSLYSATTDFAKDKSHNCAIIGLTATPFTKGLGNIYSNLIMAATMSELTNDGYLVPMRVFSCRRPDMAGAETSGGEWTDRAAEERELCIVGDVVTEWMKFAGGKKTICFGATIKHCEELCRQFNQAGILASLYTSRTNDEERAEILEAFSDLDGPLKVLISVEALAKGFDKPFVEVICDCRPLRKSFSTFIQMIGRGLRISPATGKTEALLLDFSGNILRFAEDFEHFYFNGVESLDKAQRLDSTARQEKEDYDRACPKCHHIPFVRRCSACGFEKPTVALVEHLPGTMQEITIGKAKAAESPEHLWAQIISYTRVHGNPDTMNGRAAHLYKDIMGVYPPRHFDSSVPPVEVTRAVLGKIRSRQIAFSKATRKAS